MDRRTTFRLLVALMVSLAVLAIFISPTVPSPKTVLRAKHLAQLVLLALVCLATMLAGAVSPTTSCRFLQAADDVSPPSRWVAGLVLPVRCGVRCSGPAVRKFLAGAVMY